MQRMATLLAGALLLSLSTASFAAETLETEPNNNQGSARNIDAFFSLDPDPNVYDPTSIPHATVIGSAGDGTFDWFQFTVDSANSLATFDIDGAWNWDYTGFDSYLSLFDATGNLLASNDDWCGFGGTACDNPDPGSVYGLDSFLQYQFSQAGTYAIRVGNCCVGPQVGGQGYALNVSIQGHAVNGAVPEPATWALLLMGFAALGGAMRSTRRRQKFNLSYA